MFTEKFNYIISFFFNTGKVYKSSDDIIENIFGFHYYSIVHIQKNSPNSSHQFHINNNLLA